MAHEEIIKALAPTIQKIKRGRLEAFKTAQGAKTSKRSQFFSDWSAPRRAVLSPLVLVWTRTLRTLRLLCSGVDVACPYLGTNKGQISPLEAEVRNWLAGSGHG